MTAALVPEQAIFDNISLVGSQGIIQEFDLGISSYMSIMVHQIFKLLP